MAARLTTQATSTPMTTAPVTKIACLVEAIDEAYSHIKKLEALLQNTFSESGPAFRNLNEELQDSYLWACADLAASIKTALESSFRDAGGQP